MGMGSSMSMGSVNHGYEVHHGHGVHLGYRVEAFETKMTKIMTMEMMMMVKIVNCRPAALPPVNTHEK